MGRLRQPLLRDAGEPIIHIICGYELIALHTKLLPISTLFKKLRRKHPYIAILVLLFWLLILTHHLLIEALDDIMEE